MSESDGRADEDGREIERLEKRLSHEMIRRATAESNLLEAERLRNEWCAEFVKARNALKEIFDATDPYADGVEDASAHDKLANEIACIARPWKDAQP